MSEKNEHIAPHTDQESLTCSLLVDIKSNNHAIFVEIKGLTHAVILVWIKGLTCAVILVVTLG